MGTRLFVGNLSYNVTELELKEPSPARVLRSAVSVWPASVKPAAPRGFALLKRQPTTVPSKLSKNSAVTWFKAAR